MRSSNHHASFIGLGLVALALAALTACSSGPSASDTNAIESADGAEAERAAQQAELEAQRLAQAMGRSAQPAIAPPQVQWIEPGADSPPAADRRSAQPRPTAAPEPEPEPDPIVSTEPQTPRPAAQPTSHDEPIDRKALLDRLTRQIAGSDDSALSRAMAAANLSLLDPQATIDPALLSALDPSQRRSVMLYRELVRSMARQLESNPHAFDADTAEEQLLQVFGQQPLRIRRLELCRRVRGFGVYEPFDSNTFIAGRENPMIVYVEVDHFRSVRDGDQYQVKLKQEVVLYNHADGLAVWRESPVQIVDESRNRRRDFFLVQMIRLPVNLSVGKYLLKVSLTDLNGDSVDEVSVSIHMTADSAIVGK